MNDHLWFTLDTIRDRHGQQPEVAWLLGQVEALQRGSTDALDDMTFVCRENARLREEVRELRRRVGDVGP